jgi:hypothetical protein
MQMTDRRTTPIGEMWIDDGVLWHRISTAKKITEDDAREVILLVHELAGDRPRPAVVDMRAIGFASAAARKGFAGSPETSQEVATALVVGSTSSRLMAETFLKISKPDRPIAVFTNTSEAKKWADGHRADS